MTNVTVTIGNNRLTLVAKTESLYSNTFFIGQNLGYIVSL